MPIPKSQPPANESENPYLPPGPQPLVFEQFQGIRTDTTRVGVKDEEMFWCDGYMPIGPNFLRTMWGVGSKLWTTPANTTLVYYDFANIGPIPYTIAFPSDGSIYAVRTDTGAATKIANAGTITTPTRGSIGVSQWGSKYVQIVADQTNGYWIWDGTNFFGPGTLSPAVTLTSVGAGYSTAPTVSVVGGSGSGAALVATMVGGIVTGVSVINAGSGYAATDTARVMFSGGSPTAGSLTAGNVLNGGSGYTSGATIVLTGGGGTGASLNAVVAGGAIIAATVVGAGSGYTSSPTATVSGAGSAGAIQPIISTVAAATAKLMPLAIGGTTIENYSGRVWIAKGPVVTYSAPGAVYDFSSANGGGNFTSSDSFLRVGFTQLKQTNGFLYLIADCSINYISGVSTAGTPSVTTFTNQNADPEIGTTWPGALDVFSRNIIFANSFGVHVSYGAAVTKVSDALDGIYTSAPIGSFIPSAAKAIIFGKKIWMLLLPIIDPVTKLQTNKLLMWNGKLWWAGTQDITLQYIATQEWQSFLTAWGTDGSSVYPLFNTASTALSKIVQSKFWSLGAIMLTKAASRIWGVVQYIGTANPTINVTVDSELGISSQIASFTPTYMVWTTVGGLPMTWTTVGGATMTWALPGITVFPPQAVGQTGVLLGLTIQTNVDDAVLISFALQPEIVSYRG